MSFYLSYTQDIKLRKALNIFFIKEDSILRVFNNEDEELFPINNPNPIIGVVDYIKSFNILDVEIVLSSIEDNLLDDALDYISNYLLENDNSIGLLTADIRFREDYKELLDKYGVTYTSKVEKIKKPRTTIRKAQPKQELRIPKDLLYSCGESRMCSILPSKSQHKGLALDEPFNTKLMNYLIESGKSNVEVYTKGGITRQVFSNIVSKKDLIPRKDTVICLIIGMELNYTDALDLLNSAGYALSKSIASDVVISKYLKKGIYDLNIINSELDERGCQLLGWRPR